MSSDYDSDESTGSAAFQPGATIPAPPISNDPAFESGKNGTRFLIVEHTANQRHGSKISDIWFHGGERRRCDDGSMDRYWRCGHCTTQKILKVPETGNGATSHPMRHLRNRHHIDPSDESVVPPTQPSILSTVAKAAGSAAAKTAKALISTLDIERFRYLLIRWIVAMNISLVCVEHPTWQQLMIHCHQGLAPYLVKSADTVRGWIMQEFEKQKLEIKKELATARSRIHISSDLWTSPNRLPVVGIVAHYLDKNLKVQNHLIGMRRVSGTHSGENIAEAMIPVLQEMGVVLRLGYFIGDNHDANATCLRAICRRLRPDIKDPDSRRVRCLGHILNLAAKAFLFGKDADAFEDATNSKREKGHIAELRKEWRKKGPVGKFHNSILHIRASPQRQEEFAELLVGIIEKDLEGKFNACGLHYLH